MARFHNYSCVSYVFGFSVILHPLGDREIAQQMQFCFEHPTYAEDGNAQIPKWCQHGSNWVPTYERTVLSNTNRLQLRMKGLLWWFFFGGGWAVGGVGRNHIYIYIFFFAKGHLPLLVVYTLFYICSKLCTLLHRLNKSPSYNIPGNISHYSFFTLRFCRCSSIFTHRSYFLSRYWNSAKGHFPLIAVYFAISHYSK